MGVSVELTFPAEPEAEKLLHAGNECIKNQRLAEAVRFYEDGLAHATDVELRAALLSNCCSALAHQQRWDDALQVAQKCVKLRPEWPRSHWCEGSALEGVGRQQEALDAFKRALHLDPEVPVRLSFCHPIPRALQQSLSA